MDNLVDWFYGQVVGFLGNFFSQMGNMGVELFDLAWVQAIVLFFSRLAWALFGVSVVVSCFQFGIMYVSGGRGNLQQTAISIIKGFLAVSLFTIAPVRLYALSVSLQGTLSAGITGYGTSIGEVGKEIVEELGEIDTLSEVLDNSYFGLGVITSPIMIVFCVILMAYAVIKVFFANLKRGGILLIQIAVGSLYIVLDPTRLHRRICPMVQTGDWPLFDGIPAIHHPGGRTDGIQRQCFAGPGLDAVCRRGAPHRRHVRPGHHHPRQHHVRSLYGADGGHRNPDGYTGGGGTMKRPLHIGSLFDGIGGFPLVSMRVGADPLWASEIAPFPMSVTKMRFPQMTQMGDVTQLNGATLEPVEILCGGSPCQDLSVAGSRAGLSGSRSSLFMDQIRIAKEMRYEDMRRGRPALLIRPRWFCWENVPGVFSSGTPKYEDFRLVLEAVAGIVCHSISIPGPYPWSWQYAGRTDMGVEFSMAWRVLDAQYWSSTPQRRRRVFLVADFSGRTAAKILFEQESMQRRLAENGKAGKTAAVQPGIGAGDSGSSYSTEPGAGTALSDPERPGE